MLADNAIVSPRARAASGRPRRRIGPTLRGLGSFLRRMLHNHRTRRYLAEMDARTLADLGISRAQAEFEASRWAWDWAPHRTPPRHVDAALRHRSPWD